jgi:TonB-dependent starch-binding outer membrane protein SusC
MSKKLLLCFALLIGLVSFAMAQRTVTGTITDELTKEPLIQATVVIKGTTQGTVTDENGKFKLEGVPNNAILVVSYAGSATQEVNSGVLTDINVVLKPENGVEEVIIKGYAIEDRRSSVGSIAGVKGSTIENLPMQSFDRAMQGRIAGVQVAATSGQPGGALSVRIRGIGSITGGLQPLYIIDGVQVRPGGSSASTVAPSSNALASINPNDVESIEVLKDAASSAIYGAQAANGVVIITTKRGKKGKSQIDFSVQEGIVQPWNLYKPMNTQQLAQIKYASYSNAGLPVSEVVSRYGDPNNPNLPSYDWMGAIFRTGRQRSYDISITGGDDKTTFYLSGAYTKQEGQIQRNEWSRASFKMNVSHKATDKLTLGLNVNTSWQSMFGAGEGGNNINNVFTATPTMHPFSPAVNPETGAFNIWYPTSAPAAAGQNAFHNFGYNILQGLFEEDRTSKAFQFIGSGNISYKLNKDFTLNGLGGVDFINVRDDNYRPSTMPINNINGAGGNASVFARRILNANANINIQYSKTFNSIHKVTGLLGYEYKVQQVETMSGNGRGFPNPTLRQLVSATAAASGTGSSGDFTEFARQGIFGQAKYEYNDRYFAEVTLRRDGSSRFGNENRWGTFYAAALAWRISAEEFMASTKNTISDLKLRASYGVTGNSEIGDFPWITTFGNAGAYSGSGAIRQSQLGNAGLGWEEQAQLNIGTDIELWKGKVRLTLDYWNKINSKLLLFKRLPADGGAGFNTTSGTYGVNSNVGKVLNRGFDIDLTTTNIEKGDFKWTTTFNIGFLRNEILELADGQQRIGTDYFVGQPIEVFYGSQFLGVNPANGRSMVLDTLGNPTYATEATSTQKIIGKATPDYYGGFGNTFSYKGISLDIFFQYQGGNSANLSDFYNLAAAGSSTDNQLVSQMAYWQRPGDVTSVPRPFEGGVIEGNEQTGFFSTRLLSDASYLRLKQIRLSYEVPSAQLSKYGLRRMNVFVQAINLWTYTKFAGIDPEVVGQTAANSASTYGNYPQGRQFNVGLSFGF